jgi:uncharacterized RDD family membrane protein YckC
MQKLDKRLLNVCYMLLAILAINILLYLPLVGEKIYSLGNGENGRNVFGYILSAVPRVYINMSYVDDIFRKVFRFNSDTFGNLSYSPITILLALTVSIGCIVSLLNFIRTNGNKGLMLIRFVLSLILIHSFIACFINLMALFMKNEETTAYNPGIPSLIRYFSTVPFLVKIVWVVLHSCWMYLVFYINNQIKLHKRNVELPAFEGSIFNETIEASEPVWNLRANQGKRFVNYIVDLIILMGSLYFIKDFFVELIIDQFIIKGYALIIIMSYFIQVLIMLLYYPIQEALLGYTCGKALTQTIVVTEDGNTISFGKAFTRTLSRLVPFEPFSGFGAVPWHDSWTDTYVINDKASNTLPTNYEENGQVHSYTN